MQFVIHPRDISILLNTVEKPWRLYSVCYWYETQSTRIVRWHKTAALYTYEYLSIDFEIRASVCVEDSGLSSNLFLFPAGYVLPTTFFLFQVLFRTLSSTHSIGSHFNQPYPSPSLYPAYIYVHFPKTLTAITKKLNPSYCHVFLYNVTDQCYQLLHKCISLAIYLSALLSAYKHTWCALYFINVQVKKSLKRKKATFSHVSDCWSWLQCSATVVSNCADFHWVSGCTANCYTLHIPERNTLLSWVLLSYKFSKWNSFRTARCLKISALTTQAEYMSSWWTYNKKDGSDFAWGSASSCLGSRTAKRTS